jgi:hypothetical protein
MSRRRSARRRPDAPEPVLPGQDADGDVASTRDTLAGSGRPVVIPDG